MQVDQILLRYAIRDGMPVHVSDFDHLRGLPGGREDIYCPECDGRVTVRLSPEHKKRDHFAHLPDSTCLLRGGGESAHHLNAKYYLASQLKKYRRATLIIKCAMCKNDYSYLQIPDYDDVQVERKLNRRRPDISLLNSGDTVGAAEVAYRSFVDFQRRVDLNSYGVGWFEIPALNVHPQYFRFVHEASVIGIDAHGAGVSYPRPPMYCDLCQRSLANQRRAQDNNFLSLDSAAKTLIDYAWHEGVDLDADQYGPRLSMKLSSGLYVAVSNYRREQFERSSKKSVEED